MSFIFLRNRVTGGAAFSPASLFASGEEGAWYEPSTTTCFTDTAGTIAATYGDAVARINDLSGNGNHATQATSSARPILARVPPRGRVNELSETDTLATQSVTVTAAQRTLSFTGTGTVTLTGASTAGPLVGTGAGDRVSLTFTPSAGSLTLTVLGTVTDAQLELGASATTYQSVADSLGYDITEAGVTSLEYLAFDGSDDGLSVSGIFGGVTSSNFSIISAARNFEFAPQGAHLGFNGGSSDAFFPTLEANGVVGLRYYGGSNLSAAFTHNLTSADDYVRRDYRDGAEVASYINGSVAIAPTSTRSAGTLAATNDEFLLGRERVGFAECYIYCAIVVNRTLTTDEITNTESYLAAKSGVVL